MCIRDRYRRISSRRISSRRSGYRTPRGRAKTERTEASRKMTARERLIPVSYTHLAPWLAVLCAFFMVTQIIGGNFIQSNTISGVMKENFGVPYLTTGIALVLIIFVITLGGLKRLAHVAQKLVPSMALIYVAVSYTHLDVYKRQCTGWL